MRGGVSLVILGCWVSAVVTFRCDRTPEGFIAPKTPADNRFQLKVSGFPEKYVPGEGYTVSLVGQRSPGHGQVAQKFTGFSLVVEPQNMTPLRVVSAREITPRPIGTFTLYGDSMTKFSPSCPNMVTHTSSMPKTEVQVRWTAPPPGSGCVIFRATVMEHRDVWYQDDGPLSKMLCEEVQENLDIQPHIIENCCACDEAKYEVTFEGLWSRHTHPKDFPSNSWLTRFSDIIGASHSPHYKFWEYGGFATEGLRQVAERGSTRVLESELKSHSGEIRTIIKARGISYPNVTGKTFAVFRVNKNHHLMSLVSMIDPSPDWIVGVSALELCLESCSWVESKVLNLYPWDAGTDSGITYISPDQKTFPVERIRRITSSFPNDPRSPFYDSSGAEMKPLARLYLTRQRLYEKTCANGSQSMVDGCSVTEWSGWGTCSASCGPGKQVRRREFRNSGKDCPPTRLSQTRPCVARHCRPLAQPVQESEEDPHCEKGEWSEWSRCKPVDSICKQGVQTRTRQITPKNDRPKYCVKLPTMEERGCQPSSSCLKTYKGKVFYKNSQDSTCCDGNEVEEGEEDNLYGNEENNTTDQDFPDENGGEEPGNDDNAEENGGDNVDENNDNEREGNGEDEGVEDQNGGNEENVEEENDRNEEDGADNGEENGADNGKEDGEENGADNGEEDGNGDEENGDEEGGDKEDNRDDRNEEEKPEENTNDNKFDNYDGDDENELQVEELTSECQMSQWSLWSPCSVTCGTGVKKRTRELYNQMGPRVAYLRAPPPMDSDYGTYDDETEGVYAEEPCTMYKVMEVEACNGSYQSCQLSSDEAREVCTLPPHPGLCRGPMLMRWYYEPNLEDCSQFEWTGCRGNKNRFLTKDDCKFACQAYTAELDDQTTTEEAITGDEEDLVAMGQTKYGEPIMGTDRPVRNCKFSRWSQWSECHAPCNQQGTKIRTRNIEVHAKNGGKACAGKLKKEKRCFRKCRESEGDQGDARHEDKHNNGRCRYDEWSSWTECTATCGMSAVRQRTRQVLSGHLTECTDRVHKQHCNVGGCPL